ncbi:YsnF/AvaK domain-containing protein [Clostridium formicaceticum]|uniref:Stress response protein YsnF n=1 Tax=Clostridium formicaceticum TaxID=1497 RepID=A0AAC9RNP5_9CLOT|nr:YsnF/AvaK domain-containing protein [Clostridium formicaceticum]AOY77914.1 hypothetical protein BJL90_19845 [Clostridium formicaceticum]ARE88533.1 Stress response protein YsnF [Clostridium formicaceticum]
MKKRSLADKNKNFNSQTPSLKPQSDYNDIKLPLREESLDISKDKVQIGSVNIRKEAIKEEKTITVPVIREEIIIEKKFLDDKDHEHTDTIRIPITEEHIEITKHPVVLENVDIYNKKSQDIKQIEVTLKKEKLRIQTHGDAKVIDDQADDYHLSKNLFQQTISCDNQSMP